MSQESPLLDFGGNLRADPPQRYLGNYPRYLARGGNRELEGDLRGFLADGSYAGDMARFYFFSLAFDQLVKEGVRGDFAELGVYKGNTGTLLASYARRLGTTAYLMDTFEGFAAEDLTGIDADAQEGAFSDTSLEAVRALVGEENVRFIKGFFPGTADQLPPDGRYCLVHIDCDLYAPMASALGYFYPRMVPGGFLIAHDYSSLHWNGAEKAVDEFFLDKPECPIPLPDGAGSVVIRKARPPSADGSWLDRKRRGALGPDWTEAANGRLADLLGNGWSGPEHWGVWGVGDEHILHMPLRPGSTADTLLELDVEAALTPARTQQFVEVFLGEEPLDVWAFTRSDNRGVRRLRIPAGLGAARGASAVAVVFRPRSVISTADIAPGSTDTRPLGLGLHRIRMLEG
jgi:hypothetical protein